LAGTEPAQLAVPNGWSFDGSMSQKPMFAPAGTEGDRVKFLRRENDLDVYLDYVTGKEVFIGRPAVKGDTEAALFTRVEKICHQALSLDAESEPLKASGDAEAALPLFNELQDELLPEATRIANGPGSGLAFAHFARGLILRILNRQREAEPAFRKANELQPGVMNTLLELVRCLGEQGKHQEALSFAREATRVDSTDAAAWGNLAMCLIQCGQRAEARRAIDCATDLDPDDPLNCQIRDNFEGYFK
jgi:tetratricopeptide (TPR) repeat protein